MLYSFQTLKISIISKGYDQEPVLKEIVIGTFSNVTTV